MRSVFTVFYEFTIRSKRLHPGILQIIEKLLHLICLLLFFQKVEIDTENMLAWLYFVLEAVEVQLLIFFEIPARSHACQRVEF